MTTKVLNEIYEFLVEKDPSMPHVGTIPIPTQFPYKPRPKPQCLHASNACKTCCMQPYNPKDSSSHSLSECRVLCNIHICKGCSKHCLASLEDTSQEQLHIPGKDTF